jgi:hypothetical protein
MPGMACRLLACVWHSTRSLAILIVTLLASACGERTVPTAPSDRPVLVRLGVNPPTIQATSGADGWSARWNVLLDAATEYPPDSANAVIPFASEPVAIESVQSILTAADGRVLVEVTHTAAEIRAANGSNELSSARTPLVRPCCTVSDQVSYTTPFGPPSRSALRIVVRLRDSRGNRQQFIRMSAVYEALCGYKGGPPCG